MDSHIDEWQKVMNKISESVSIIVEDYCGRVAVSRRVDPNAAFYDFYQFPGGSVNRAESPNDAACRELFEETGLALPQSRFYFMGRTERPHVQEPDRIHVSWNYRVWLRYGETLKCTEIGKQTPWTFWTVADCMEVAERFIPGLLEGLR